MGQATRKRKRDGRSKGRPSFVPVYTLHEMNQELHQRVPVIICTGCGHPIAAPANGASIQCRDCGRKMHVVSIVPVTQTTQATTE